MAVDGWRQESNAFLDFWRQLQLDHTGRGHCWRVRLWLVGQRMGPQKQKWKTALAPFLESANEWNIWHHMAEFPAVPYGTQWHRQRLHSRSGDSSWYPETKRLDLRGAQIIWIIWRSIKRFLLSVHASFLPWIRRCHQILLLGVNRLDFHAHHASQHRWYWPIRF